MPDLLMPKLGLTMTEATLTEWLKREGEYVREGEPLFVFETDKSTLEFESPVSGVLTRILVKAGETVPVYTVVGVIDEPSQSSAPSAAPDLASDTSQAASVPAPMRRVRATPRAKRLARQHGIDLSSIRGSGEFGRIHEVDVRAALHRVPAATPLARRMAQVHALDLSTVQGSGRDGKIMRADVEAQLAAHSAEPTAESATETADIAPFTPIRALTARRMAQSHAEVAPVTLTTEADAANLVAAREQLSALMGEKLSYNALFIAVAARTLREFPDLNASFTPNGLRHNSAINIGLAVDTERGLIVPVVPHADKRALDDIHQTLKTLIERAQAGKSLPADLEGGTFTITNLGTFEIDLFTPIVVLPQVAILGVGRIVEKVVPHDGEIVIRPRISLSLTFDHRAVDGAPAARFFKRLKMLIENPLALLLSQPRT
ncbi:MAG: dihydrolipoamide acetyltransferase family protein [Anaerolineae bacterium]|nr:dihydrolipoamide acetyltransferase family protein [Anaerolineae bacterium]